MLFRLAYAFRLRTGLIRLQMPQYKWTDRPLATWLKKTTSSKPKFLEFVEAELFHPVSWDPQTAIAEADRILNGEIKYFAHEFHQTGFPPDWHKLPSTLATLISNKLEPPFQADENKHWSQISDDANVDIKFIWEPNRFAFVYTLVRAYAASHDEKYPEAFWQAVESWTEAHPPNTGPNWMDGQEIALRLMAWIFGYYAFLKSPSSTPERISHFAIYIAAQAEHIYQNRSFAVFTHNNHSITEAFALWMTGLLFTGLKNSEKYLAFGKLSLEREARAQIFPDGTYLMYSLNYHRFVLQIYLYALQLAKLNNVSFSDDLKKLIRTSLDYLSQLIEPQTGQMPVYGSNDGALVLPLNNCDFTDYRPLLQSGWYITKGEYLFEPGEWDEDLFWLCGETAGRVDAGSRYAPSELLDHQRHIETSTEAETLSFPHGGTYLLHNTNSKAVIRCTDFTARPSHADQLHVDLWIHGHNIAVDAGTYLYSGEGIWRNGLARTSVHNTVTVDGKDQMTMLSRFTWTNWSKGKVLKHEKNLWMGKHDGYKPVSHTRTVMALEGDRWLVIDHLVAKVSHHYVLQWLLEDGEYGSQELASAKFDVQLEYPNSKLFDSKLFVQLGLLEGNGNFSIVRADPNSTRGWRSRYYGHKEPAVSVMLEADQPQVTFWTFFGYENDVVEVAGKSLKINSKNIPL
jgi:hypothetical protein